MLVVLLAPALTSGQTGPPPPLMPRGLVSREEGVSPGYLLFGPLRSSSTYLIDNDGRVVHEWKGQYAGGGGYLLESGNLLRMGRDPDALHFRAGGVSGYLQEVDWEGRVVWEWKLSDERRILHHDIKPLANGNILALAWEAKSREEVLRAGRRPETAPEQGLHSDWVLEIEPVRPRGAKIVWEWHVWDHLVQDRDPNAPHYGDPAKYAGRLDLNAVAAVPTVNPRQLAQLQALGYVPEEAVPADLEADFLHINSIDHHAELDQFALSVPALGEIWVIDHSTSTAQAAGSTGGRARRVGDLLYRWGNPANYGRGASWGGAGAPPQRLFFQHDARWVPKGFPGAGNLTIFNNGRNRPGAPRSTVDEITPPLKTDGTYAIEDGAPFGPDALAWSWRLPADRFSPFVSGAERLANGNTIVCSGTGGIFLEVTAGGRVVWEYRNPFSGNVRLADGSAPQPGIDAAPFTVFRVSRIPPDHPGLRGHDLAPLNPQPAWAEEAGAGGG
jgi:hypothetical protein